LALKLGVTRGQDLNHRQSPRGDPTSSVSTSRLGHDQGQGEAELWDIIHTKDARGQIENCSQDRDRVE
jgi:hypothetical protein